MKAPGRKNLSKLQDFAQQNSLDAIAFVNYFPLMDANINYFSGFTQRAGSCMLLIKERQRILLVPSLDYQRALKQADVEEVVDLGKYNNSYLKALKKNFKLKKLGVVQKNLNAKLYEELAKAYQLKDVGEFVSELRSIKLEEEIKLLKKSAKISNHALKLLEEVLEGIARGKQVTKRELCILIKQALEIKGAEPGFWTMVATDKETSLPHFPPPSAKPIKRNTFGMIDFGCAWQGYHVDLTLPFVIGEIGEKQRKIVHAEVEAYELALSLTNCGKSVQELYERISNFLKSKGFKLVHAVGHGIGLAVHEFPSISPKPKNRKAKEVFFKPNMCFTIEPGIYVNGVGGCRLENTILLKKKKVLELTKARVLEI